MSDDQTSLEMYIFLREQGGETRRRADRLDGEASGLERAAADLRKQADAVRAMVPKFQTLAEMVKPDDTAV